jgi:hypothetical protein
MDLECLCGFTIAVCLTAKVVVPVLALDAASSERRDGPSFSGAAQEA